MDRDDLVCTLLSSEAHLCVNKEVARAIGLKGAVLLADLISKYRYFKGQGTLTDGTQFYNSQPNIEKDTTLSSDVQHRTLKKLSDAGLVKITRRGMPAANYFELRFEAIIRLIVGDREKDLFTSTIPTTKTARKKEAPTTVEVPAALSESVEFKEAWDEWVKYRVELKKKLPPSTIRRQMGYLSKYQPEQAAGFLRNAIEKGWQFPYETRGETVHKVKNGSYYQDAIPGSR